MPIYTVHLTFDTLKIEANLAEASAPIRIITDENDGGGASSQSTPFQTADVCHSERRMVREVLRYLGSDYYLDPTLPIVDDGDSYTIDGKTEDEYLDSLIVSIE